MNNVRDNFTTHSRHVANLSRIGFRDSRHNPLGYVACRERPATSRRDQGKGPKGEREDAHRFRGWGERVFGGLISGILRSFHARIATVCLGIEANRSPFANSSWAMVLPGRHLGMAGHGKNRFRTMSKSVPCPSGAKEGEGMTFRPCQGVPVEKLPGWSRRPSGSFRENTRGFRGGVL